MNTDNQQSVEAVRSYWNKNTLGLQYASDETLEPGTPEFFAHIRPWMNPYKFPWIMERIEREAQLLRGKHLLEVGCGMGFDSLEFLKRGVRVTATDLTENAVRLARKHFEIEGVQPESVQVENALSLSFPDETFDAVWANGVLHATSDTQRAIHEVRRVLKPGGRAIISHFYRRPSWMWTVHRLGKEPIEAHEEDPPVNEFYTDDEILAMFDGRIGEDEAIDTIITRTRQFAVRQERWFRRDPRVRWIDIEHDPVAEATAVVIEALDT